MFVTAPGVPRDGTTVGLSPCDCRRLMDAPDLTTPLGIRDRAIGLDPAVTVHSLRVTVLTTARERGADIVDLQDFAGHADPRTTLTYIRSRDRLSKSPTYVLNY